MTDEKLVELINRIPYNQFEWDSAILAKHLKPILMKLASGSTVNVGDLGNLSTEDKSDLVSAINEIYVKMEDLEMGEIEDITTQEIDSLFE